VSNDCFYVPDDLLAEQIKDTCVRIYKILAKSDLTLKVYDYAVKMGVAPSVVKVNSATSRWGSCSSKRSLNFSWRLIMADDDVIESNNNRDTRKIGNNQLICNPARSRKKGAAVLYSPLANIL
jgi:hypothetical protein